jgi:lipoprotein-releasing system permease protein
MQFELQLAMRHLRSGGSQTALIIGGVAMAVTLVIFISGLIMGLQTRILDTVTGALPHVIVTARERTPRAPTALPGSPGAVVIPERQQREWQPDRIEDWQAIARQLASYPHVVAVSPGVQGQALVEQAGIQASVLVVAGLPERVDAIVGLSDDLVAGEFLGLQTGEVVIGYKLAEELRASLGDRVRLTTAGGTNQTFRIAGIVGGGRESLDLATMYMNLRSGQSLLGTGQSVTSLQLKLDNLFAADEVAAAIEGSLALQTDTWIKQTPDLQQGLRAQSATSHLISGFSLIAAGFAISSVLIVSVLRRSREIGILKSMGARGRQILLVFTLEGLGISFVGSVLGAILGSGLILALAQIKLPPQAPGQEGRPLFPGAVSVELVLGTIVLAMVITVVAAVLPARQAARLDPVEVIRRG